MSRQTEWNDKMKRMQAATPGTRTSYGNGYTFPDDLPAAIPTEETTLGRSVDIERLRLQRLAQEAFRRNQATLAQLQIVSSRT